MAFESFCATEQKVDIIPNIIAIVIVIVNLSPFITFVIIIVVAIILQWLLKAFADRVAGGDQTEFQQNSVSTLLESLSQPNSQQLGARTCC